MNFKTTVTIFAAAFTIVAIGAIFLVFHYQSKNSEIENFMEIENTTPAENLKDFSSTFAGIRRSDILDAPTVPLQCSKGMRYDVVSNKCKRVLK